MRLFRSNWGRLQLHIRNLKVEAAMFVFYRLAVEYINITEMAEIQFILIVIISLWKDTDIVDPKSTN